MLSSKAKDSLVIPDSLELYRSFVQRNPLMTFKLHMIWRNQGVKFPARTNYTRDVLLEYLNEDGPDANGDLNDSTCYIYGFKHSFFKQKPLLIVELEVIGMQSANNLNNPVHGTISLPEMNILYRNYNNIVEFAVNKQYDDMWVSGSGVSLTRSGEQYIARVHTPSREVSISLYSNFGNDTTLHGAFKFRTSNLPLPTIYWGTLSLNGSQFQSINDSNFLQMGMVFAKYPPEIPLKASFEVGEMKIRIGDSTYMNKGKTVSKEIIDAYINAEQGTVFTIESVEVRGPIHEIITIPFTRTKSTAKGKRFNFPKGILYSEGC
ncbi:MAG: hypothetical protein V4604_00980 [Bacteroidota bacterium]